MPEPEVALVTGAARRIGAVIAETLHGAGYRVAIHCHRSRAEADALAGRLNASRRESAHVIEADLLRDDAAEKIVHATLDAFGRLDLLVNNASNFLPTAVGATTREQWNDLVGSNFAAPYFLCQAAAAALRERRGAIINLVDIHAERPLSGHAVYSASKAALHMLTRALAKELAPEIRVNGISPGAILWPEAEIGDEMKAEIVARTPLLRTGTPQDIADTALFLARAPFITGQVVAVDGGRSL